MSFFSPKTEAPTASTTTQADYSAVSNAYSSTLASAAKTAAANSNIKTSGQGTASAQTVAPKMVLGQ